MKKTKTVFFVLIVILITACILVKFLVKKPSEKQETAPSVAVVREEPQASEVQIPTPKEECKIAKKEKERDPFTKPEILTKLEKENEKLKKELKTLKAQKTKKIEVAKKHRKVEKVKTPKKAKDEDKEEIRELIREINEKLNELERSKQAEIQEYEAEPEEEYYEEPKDDIIYRPLVSFYDWPYYSPYGYSYYYGWGSYSFLGGIWWAALYMDWYSYWYYPSYRTRWDRTYPRYYTRLNAEITRISKNQLKSRYASNAVLDSNNPNKQTLGSVAAKSSGKFIKTGKTAIGKISKTGEFKTYPSRIPKQKIQKIRNQGNLSGASGEISKKGSGKYQTPWGDSRDFNKSFKSTAKTRSRSSRSSGKYVKGGSYSGKKVSSSSAKQKASTSSGRGKVTKSTSGSSGKVKKK